jgi:phage/plasmid primase-like uncharacterized protein
VSGKDLKFHPKVFVGKNGQTGKSVYAPALVAIVRDINGKDLSAQVTYLDKETANKLNTDIQKRTLGKITGKAVTLSGSKENQAISFIAEGVETGLSIQEAIKGAHVMASLGKHNMKNIDPRLLAEQVILVADNDGKTLKQDKQLLEAAARLKHAGKDVYIVMPESIGAKTDLNDVLREKGVDGLKQTLAATVKVDEDHVGTDHTHDEQQAVKRFNSNSTHLPGDERESMQSYNDGMRQQHKQSIRGLDQERTKASSVNPSADQLNRQAQIDREI